VFGFVTLCAQPFNLKRLGVIAVMSLYSAAARHSAARARLGSNELPNANSITHCTASNELDTVTPPPVTLFGQQPVVVPPSEGVVVVPVPLDVGSPPRALSSQSASRIGALPFSRGAFRAVLTSPRSAIRIARLSVERFGVLMDPTCRTCLHSNSLYVKSESDILNTYARTAERRPPHDMELPYGLVLFMESEEVGVVKWIKERHIPIAREQGWHVMSRDTDLLPATDIEPAQSNPRRGAK